MYSRTRRWAFPCVLATFVLGWLSVGNTGLFAANSPAGESAPSELRCEGAIPAAEVKAGKTILRYQATRPQTITGFYTRLTNCVGPRGEPTVVGLRFGDAMFEERAGIPVYGAPLAMYTRSEGGRVFPPLDVGQEYRTALAKPIDLKSGDSVVLEVISSEPLTSGLTAGLQFAGTWRLSAMREPFRVVKDAGPVSRVEWSKREVVCTGNQKKHDPLCAPQNSSGVVFDADGSLFQFTAYYSIDEQHGPEGRLGSFSRTYGFRKGPADRTWQPLGLVADPVPTGFTYFGDPFAFRDLDGTPCLVYTTCNGTDGFADWTEIGAHILKSTSSSFAGPWSKPHAIFEGIRRNDLDRVNCLRVYPRSKTKDYVVAWLHGSSDISNKAAILPNLDATLTPDQLRAAPTLTRNQEEGGGGFVRGDRGYLSTWQIPGINDVTAVQRLYEFDLYDPLNPEKWRVVPGSLGWNDPTHPIEDGGATADSWSVSYQPESDTLWATSVVWSESLQNNSTLACSVPWDKQRGTMFWFGCPLAWPEIAPVVEYALGTSCCLSATVTATGPNASILVCLAPSQRPLFLGGVALEVSGQGARLVACSEERKVKELTPYQGQPFVPNRPYRVRLQRSDYRLTAWVDDQVIGPVSVTETQQQTLMNEPQRFKFYSAKGGLYSIRDAVLVDGPGGG